MNGSLEKGPEKRRNLTMRDLYPTLSEDELRGAAENFCRYCEIVLQIHEEQHSFAADQFDTSQNLPSMKERSNVSLKE
jgi:hypothetical protein